jgi:NAD(P)-dependent dehydrogenase (short-subunit alcohol dehydrogenase family)
MWFASKKKEQSVTNIPDGTRIVVCIGGAGMFGKTVLNEIPSDVLFVNVSRRRVLLHPQVINIALDVMGLAPDKLIENICKHVPRIDTLVYGAFMSYYKPIEHMSDTEMKHECELLALRPIGIANAFRKYAHNNPQKQKRVYIAIGSGIYKGLPQNRMDLGSYGASKAYLHYAMVALTKPLAEVGVRTVILHPGSLNDKLVREKTVSTLWNEVQQKTVSEKIIIHDIF